MVRLGLIGYPLGHSFSPAYFKQKFEREGIEGRYDLFPLDEFAEFDQFLADNPDLNGFNVTIPYKQVVMSRLDFIDAAATEIGAVNTVRINHLTNRLEGCNTDWIGFRDSLMPLLAERRKRTESKPERALVLGTGGSARAVAYALHHLGIEPTFVSRDKSRSTLQPAIEYEDLNAEVVAGFPVIVNCTPCGMWPNVDNAPSLCYEALTHAHICYDLIYNPEETKFLRLSREQGAITSNGLEMLHRQADAAYKFITQQ